MSRNRNRKVNEVNKDQVIDGEIVEETEEETPEVVEEKAEKKPSKARALWKKGKWILLGAGIAGLAFFAGRSSNNDEMALAALEAEYGDGKDSEESDDSDDAESETSTEE